MKNIAETNKPRRRHRMIASESEPREIKVIVFMLAAIPILSTIAYGAVDTWAVSFLSIITGFVVILWLANTLRKKAFVFSTSALQIPIICLISIACVQLLPLGNSGVSAELLNTPIVNTLSLDAYATRFFLIRLVIAFVFFAAALTFIDSEKRLKRVAILIVVFGAVIAFAGILQRLTSPDAIYGLRPTPQAIPFGPFVNQHHFAALMEMTSGLTLGIILAASLKRDKIALLVIPLALMGIALTMTGSRGGFLSILGVIGFGFAARFLSNKHLPGGSAKRGSTLAAAAGLSAVLILVACTAVFLSGGDPLLRGIGVQENQTDVTSGRAHFWSVGLRIFLDNPIIGAGFDAFAVAFTRYDSWNGLLRVEQAHNDYLQILADAGVLGFICIAAFIFLFFKKGLNVIKNASEPFRRSVAIGSMAGCFGVMIHSFFDFPLRTQSNTFFFLLLVVLATVSVGTMGSNKA